MPKWYSGFEGNKNDTGKYFTVLREEFETRMLPSLQLPPHLETKSDLKTEAIESQAELISELTEAKLELKSK